MTVFIGFVSNNWDHNRGTRISTSVAQRNMVQMCNPFVVQFLQSSKQLKDGLHLHLSSLCPCKVFVLWGAKINPFHDIILKTGIHVRNTLEDQSSEDFISLEAIHIDRLRFTEAGDHELNIPCPVTLSSDSLGNMPRKRYPATVVTFIDDVSFEEAQTTAHHNRENSIIGLVSIIHLQDDKVTQNSNILSQFVKTVGVQLYSLQPLYLSNGPDLNHSTKPEPRSDDCKSQRGEMSAKNINNLKVENGNHNLWTDKYENCIPEEKIIEKHSSCVDSVHLDTSPDDELNLEDNKPLENFPECVVCQTKPVSCALLPCRHACVCISCFKLLDRCPMCRGALDSYFLLSGALGDDDDVNEEGSVADLQHQAVSEYFSQKWERFNLRLNALLGFR
ncbi:hypothetical protein Btru_056714 [Bulinus truncatus]|nr:hypothetical protein Btru_056714 [Bulinus truncatus]